MTTQQTFINGIDTESLGTVCEEIAADRTLGHVQIATNTAWAGGTRTETAIELLEINGEVIPRGHHSLATDEPKQLLGGDTAANPQELLLAGLAGCMMVGFVAGCSVHGIELTSVHIKTKTSLDLRGFLGLDAAVIPGVAGIEYEIHVEGQGTEDQYEAIHQHVLATSPNFYNLSQPIAVSGKVVPGGAGDLA
jgi:uncharacterized OsmC-like protein